MRFVKIGAHPLTDRQKQLLEKAGLREMVEEVKHVENPAEVVKLAKEKGAKAIVIQALPLQLIVPMLQAAQREGVDVLRFAMETIATVAPSAACPEGTEVERVTGGVKRCVRTARLERIKRIVIETETVAE